MVIIANDNKELQKIIGKFEEGMKGYGTKMNIEKTKVMRLYDINCTYKYDT